MFEVKPMSVEKKETAVGTDDGRVCSGRTGTDDAVYLYEGQDWLLSPSCSPEQPSGISPLLAQETLRYMIFSAERVEQVTKTYNDIEMVTHLLDERDRDLELAARIGQSLLQRNHVLQERSDSLEEQLAQALDQVHQLQHELGKKEELLRMVASTSEESETDSSCSTPLRHPSPAGASHTLSHMEALQSKLHDLEEENQALRSEVSHVKKVTITYEEKEQQLVSDCVKELRELNGQMGTLSDELSQKNEAVLRHQEEIAQLLSQIVQLQQRVRELALEKEELRIHLQASKDAQRQLTAELKEMADRNTECVGMLQECQEEVKELRNKNSACVDLRRRLPYDPFSEDSLAAEIEGSMRRELSVEEEIAFQDQRSSHERVFQTVRCVNTAVGRAAAPPIPGSGHCGTVMTAQPFSSQANRTQEQNTHPHTLEDTPPSPGGNDLVSALHRLSLRRQNFLCERQYFQAERDRKLQEGAGSESGGSGCSSPGGTSASSFTSLSGLSHLSSTSSCFRTFLPEKLQIVKPMQGSLTLHHWQQLAKPHLATILDPHPGVVTKGFRPLPQGLTYRLSDLEEDQEHDKPSWDKRREGRGAREERKRQEEEEEEEEGEGGITFHVQSASTPEEKRERRFPASLNTPPLSSTLRVSPVAVETAVSMGAAASLAVTSVSLGSAVPLSQPSPTVSTMAPSTVNPGKCQSSTFSTYTFTTCRILHPSDVTQVTSSSVCSPSVREYTPSSLRTGPSTPVTPCRLSLEDSFSPRCPAAPPGGLAKLLLEKGISAQGTPASSKLPLQPPHLHSSNPPTSPSLCPGPSPLPLESRNASSDNFLASRPAELFLQDVYGVKLGRAPRPDLPSPEPTPMEQLSNQDQTSSNLVQRLQKLGLDKKVLRGAQSPHCRESATFLATGGSLLDGLRRNQSLPSMIGRRHTSVPSFPAISTHPTSLGPPSQAPGHLKPNSTHRHASLSCAPPVLPKD